jgi:heme exporter protein C
MISRERALGIAKGGQIVTAVALVALAGIFVRALVFTPVERLQGPAQITGILSIVYLWLKDRRIDMAAASSAEVGVAFAVVMLTTGPIWGKPVWGTWWTWDARLTSTLFIFLLFIGYLIMRDAVTDPDTRGRFSAVLGILGLVLVPFIHITVYLFRTLHPEPIVLKPSAPSLPGEMLVTLLASLAVFTVLYFGFMMQRYALGSLRELREQEVQSAP